MNYPKLTCAPDPPPVCTTSAAAITCLAPPIKCIAVCDSAVNGGACVTTCCAVFANTGQTAPEAVPISEAKMIGLTAIIVALAAWYMLRYR